MKRDPEAIANLQPGHDEPQEMAQVIPIRTETVLSQYPIHRLSKGSEPLEVCITTANDRGKVSTVWEVSANRKYGEPGILAYKLDTLFINRLIDDLRPDIPEVIKLGSLRDVCKELGTTRNTDDIKRALYQNAFAAITAKLEYTGHDGTKRRFEFGSTRYAVVFTGETLPNGHKADAVYIVLNPIFREVLRYAKTRPLDYKYLRELPPSAQRLYELISPKIFAAINNGNDRAKYLYSDLCRFAPLTRYDQWEKVKKQLYKIHQPHKASGYLAKIEFEETFDKESKADWLIWYTPGRRAKAEFKRFNTKEGRELDKHQRRQRPHLVTVEILKPAAIEGAISTEHDNQESALIKRLIDAGVTESVARELVGRDAAECERQLEFLPYRDRVKDKGGYLVRAIRDRYAMPSKMEEAKRKEQETQKRAERFKQHEEEQARQRAGETYFQFFEPAFREFQRRELAIIEQKHRKEYAAFKSHFDAAHGKGAKMITGKRQLEWFTLRKAAEFFNEKRPELGLRLAAFDEWDENHNADHRDPLDWYNADPQGIFEELDRRFKTND